MMMSSLQVCPRDVVASDVVAALEMCPPLLSVEDLKNYFHEQIGPQHYSDP